MAGSVLLTLECAERSGKVGGGGDRRARPRPSVRGRRRGGGRRDRGVRQGLRGDDEHSVPGSDRGVARPWPAVFVPADSERAREGD